MNARLLSLPIGLAAVACNHTAPPLPEVTDPLVYVDPTIGTGGLGFNYGSCFVGAAAPHGIAKPAPDTSSALYGTVSFQHYSGYFAEDDRIRGFSQLHLHGTGATDYGILSVMPTLAFDPAKTSVVDYEAHFAKSAEHAAAGAYAVTLDSGIAVELTATPRVAVHRYTLPSAGTIVIDLDKTLDSGTVDAASLAVDDAAMEVSGQLHHLGGMSKGFGGYTVYFVLRATSPWTQHAVWSAGAPASTTASSATGTKVGAALSVPAGATTFAIGLSFVSLAGARANLGVEAPAIDFDAIAAATRATWSNQLGVVKVTGGSDAQRRTFYTGLYHAFLMPSVIGDADGTYVTAGATAPQVAQDFTMMSDLSLWDTYRTVEPLYAWLAPADARDVARSLGAFGAALGAFPKWPIAIGEAGTMIGASAEIVLGDAVSRGIAVEDAATSYAMLRDAAMDPSAPAGELGGRDRVASYMQYGYVPRAAGVASVSLTTEYANDDFGLANLAGAVGRSADRDALLARRQSWRALYDGATGFLRGRNSDGTFQSANGFDPTAQTDEYTEANAWQSLWMAGVHDPDGLAQIFGGTDAAVAKLEQMFSLTQHDFETADPSAANFPRPYYWAGNEPDLNAVFALAQLGARDRAVHWLYWLLDTWFTDQPDGSPGNDDGGTMGSWYVLASLGLYPVAGSDAWIVAAPHFPRARVTVGGNELVISVDGDGERVAAVELDGVAITGPTITHAQLATARTLHFTMTP